MLDDQEHGVALTQDIKRHVMASHEADQFASRNPACLAPRNSIPAKSTRIETADNRLLGEIAESSRLTSGKDLLTASRRRGLDGSGQSQIV